MFNDHYTEVAKAYPNIIKKHLDGIFLEVLNVLPNELIVSIILLGSTSRHELSYIEYDHNKVDLYSDYEFLLVVKKQLPVTVSNKLKNAILQLERKYKIQSPLFSIDYGVVSLSKLRITPNTLWAYEVSRLGVVVWGQDVRRNIPEVKLDNLDYGNLNWLLVVRLWSALYHLPGQCITNNQTQYEYFLSQMIYVRNILEIPTISLPKVGRLIAGYIDRDKTISEKHELLPFLSECEISVLHIALGHKLKPSLSLVSHKSYSDVFFVTYIKLLSYVSDVPSWNYSPSTLPSFIDSVSRAHPFKDSFLKSVRRKSNELNYFSDMISDQGVVRSIYWMFNDKRYNLLGFLISLHAILSRQFSPEKNQFFLHEARDYLENCIGKDVTLPSLSLSENVLYLRKQALIFMSKWYYRHRQMSFSELSQVMDYIDSRDFFKFDMK